MTPDRTTVRALPRVVILSLLSGVVWAGIAWVVGLTVGVTKIIWGGLIVAPLIGLLAGFASFWFPSTGRLRKALFSLVGLYAAAGLFGIGMGAWDWWTGPNLAEGSRRVASAVVLQGAMATLWGLTFFGYFILLWPLAYANHALLSRAWGRTTGRSQEVPA